MHLLGKRGARLKPGMVCGGAGSHLSPGGGEASTPGACLVPNGSWWEVPSKAKSLGSSEAMASGLPTITLVGEGPTKVIDKH